MSLDENSLLHTEIAANLRWYNPKAYERYEKLEKNSLKKFRENIKKVKNSFLEGLEAISSNYLFY